MKVKELLSQYNMILRKELKIVLVKNHIFESREVWIGQLKHLSTYTVLDGLSLNVSRIGQSESDELFTIIILKECIWQKLSNFDPNIYFKRITTTYVAK